MGAQLDTSSLSTTPFELPPMDGGDASEWGFPASESESAVNDAPAKAKKPRKARKPAATATNAERARASLMDLPGVMARFQQSHENLKRAIQHANRVLRDNIEGPIKPVKKAGLLGKRRAVPDKVVEDLPGNAFKITKKRKKSTNSDLPIVKATKPRSKAKSTLPQRMAEAQKVRASAAKIRKAGKKNNPLDKIPSANRPPRNEEELVEAQRILEEHRAFLMEQAQLPAKRASGKRVISGGGGGTAIMLLNSQPVGPHRYDEFSSGGLYGHGPLYTDNDPDVEDEKSGDEDDGDDTSVGSNEEALAQYMRLSGVI